MSFQYILLAVLIMMACSFALRAFPFIAVNKVRNHPVPVFLGRAMPPGIMVILVFYSINSVNYKAFPYGAPGLISIAVVIVIHHLWRQPLLSIGTGTAIHIFLLQLF